MTTAEVLAAHGILRAPEVIELAAAAKLDLACACVLLIKESGGGRNVYGHDPVPTAGTYDKGAVVTQANYTAYRAAVARGEAGRQGVGPTQLTHPSLQQEADAAGGCWDWRTNVLVGFRHLADLIAVAGVRDGFRRYNGSGPPAEKYADDAMHQLEQWRAWLADTPEDDVPLTDQDAQKIADMVWRRPTANVKGAVVGAEQILAGAEGRIWDVQDRIYELLGHIHDQPAADTVVTVNGGTVDLELLADRVAALVLDRLHAALTPPQ